MKHICLLLIIHLWSNITSAQAPKIEWAEIANNSDFYFLGEPAENTVSCFLYEGNKSKLVQYENGKMIKSKPFSFTSNNGKSCDFISIYQLGGKNLVIYSETESKTGTLFIYSKEIDAALELSEERMICSIPKEAMEKSTRITVSSKNDNLCVLKSSKSKEGDSIKLVATVFDSKLNKVAQNNFIISNNDDEYTFLNNWTFNRNYLAMAVNITLKNKTTSTHVYAFDMQSGGIKKAALVVPEMERKEFNTVYLLFDQHDNLLVLTHWGFRFIHFRYEIALGKIVHTLNIPDEAFSAAYANTMESNTYLGPANWLYFMDTKLLPTGEIMVVAQQEETKLKSITDKTPIYEHHYGGMVCYKLSAEGKLQWAKYISRETLGNSSDNHCRVLSAFTGTGVVMLYNKAVSDRAVVLGKSTNHISINIIGNNGDIISETLAVPEPSTRFDFSDALNIFDGLGDFFGNLKKEVYVQYPHVFVAKNQNLYVLGDDSFKLFLGKIKW